MLLPLHEQVQYVLLNPHFYVHIHTNQSVCHILDKSFLKKKTPFAEWYSLILKYHSYRSYTKFLNKIFINITYWYKLNITVYLVLIWTHKNADDKAHTFSRRKRQCLLHQLSFQHLIAGAPAALVISFCNLIYYLSSWIAAQTLTLIARI